MEYANLAGDLKYQRLFEKGVEFILNRLENYDLGFWSRYCLHNGLFRLPDIASLHYHDVHIAQLKVLGMMTNQKKIFKKSVIFAEYQKDWKKIFHMKILKSTFKIFNY